MILLKSVHLCAMANLNYKEFGLGEPVIILHGLLGMLDNWKTFARQLAEEYWVIIVDQRNHGKSFHSEVFNYEVLAEDLKTFMDELHLPKAHLIGHSMGGKTVMKFAQMYTDMVDKAVVVDISPSGSIGSHSHIFESLLGVEIAEVTARKEVEEELVGKGIELGVAYFLMKNLRRDVESGGFAWKANIQVLWDNYQNILEGTDTETDISLPMLFLGGSRSNYITEEDLTQIKELFPDYQYAVIEDAGHWVHADQPDLLLEKVTSFFMEDE